MIELKTSDSFQVEQEVRLIANKKKRGTVIGNKLSGGSHTIAVEWEDGTLAKVNVNDVEVCLSIEEEFKLVQDDVNSKLQEAARLIREAANLAQANGKDLIEPEYGGATSAFDINCIESAMDDAGWATSSWYC